NETGTWVRKRLIRGSRLVFSPAVMGDDDRIHVAFKRNHNNDLVYGALDGGAWEEETVESIPGVGSTIVGAPAIQLSPAGAPHILYPTSREYDEGNDLDEMKFAARDARGWDIETIADGAAGYAFENLAFDSTGRPHVTFSEAVTELAPWETVYGWKDDQWNLEMIDGVGWAYSLMIDLDDAPIISYQLDDPPIEELFLSYREFVNYWANETVLSTEGNLFHAISTIRNDGTIDLLSSVAGDPILPHSAFYATNSGGSWAIEPLGIFGGNVGMVVVVENPVNFLVHASGGPPPPPPQIPSESTI
ncbi:MAG: hypothetical protein KJ042_00620, partial [Deltaproteobacteria bacterium]|nr:hypothetical protein [Deltaproteobacteria bacterium]